MKIEIELRIGRDRHPISRSHQVIPRIVMEADPLTKYRRSIHTRNVRKHISEKTENCRGSLLNRLHVPQPLTDCNLRHLVDMDTEFPVHPGFGGRIVCLILLFGRLPNP